ncbi:MAG: SAM-dependent methyltransferase [bacterium]|nr:SAM-dependent methyltransferase [bacterium]
MGLRLSILLVSFSGLAYEILLIRLFSITQWHHFAYMMISLALLGFGVSGTFLTLGQNYFLRHWKESYLINVMFFALGIPFCYLLAHSIPFNALEILWQPGQFWNLLGIYLILALPFFFAANAIALSFMRYPAQVGKLYRYDLLGAGLGGLGILALLWLMVPWQALTVLALIVCLGGLTFMAAQDWAGRRWRGLLPTLVVAGVILLIPISRSNLNLSEYKELSKALEIPDTRILKESSSPLGWLAVVESPTIPFRHAPGLSLNNIQEPPKQLGLFIDGGGMTPLTHFSGNLEDLQYLDFLTSAAPYALLKGPRVLLLGGGVSGLLSALFHDSSQVDWVELNPQIYQLLKDSFSDFLGEVFSQPQIRAHISDARAFAAHYSGDPSFDLIELNLLDPFGASSAGLYSLSENYLYTVEALRDYLSLSSPQGILAITRWLRLPPRDSLKLFGMALSALREMGVTDPGKHLVLIRSWKISTLLIKKTSFETEELRALQGFAQDRSFDLAYYPGMKPNEANRFNQMEKAYFYEATQKLLGPQAEEFLKNYKFNLEAARDDRPFFFHFLKWRTLPELYSLRDQGGLPLIEWGYPILLTVLIQALLASILLILLPLFWLKRRTSHSQGHGGILMYFMALGLAFLFLEMSFIQKFILYLGHPLYSISVVLASFLVFAGLGSGYSHRWRNQWKKGLGWATGGILSLGLTYLFLLPVIFKMTLGLTVGFRILLSIVIIAPLAFFMGMPFPLGLALVGKKHSAAIPWAWGINGCASVLSSVLATLLAIHLGFSTVILIALGLYLLAPWFIFPLISKPSSSP